MLEVQGYRGFQCQGFEPSLSASFLNEGQIAPSKGQEKQRPPVVSLKLSFAKDLWLNQQRNKVVFCDRHDNLGFCAILKGFGLAFADDAFESDWIKWP
jgi:hypothetical protein